MKKLKRRVSNYLMSLGVFLTVFLIMGHIYGVKAEAAAMEKRLYGNNRYETAVAISRHGWESSQYVVLAGGEGSNKFADALAGSTLAHVLDAPLLLTPLNSLDDHTLREIRRLNASKVYILGGFGVISEKVEDELAAMGLEVERIRGEDRYATSAMIARIVKEHKSFDRAILTTGLEFQYSVMAAPFGAADNVPILFTDGYTLAGTVKDVVKDLNISRVDIIGGTVVVSRNVENALKDMGVEVKRIGGDDIYETNVNIINEYGSNIRSIAIARDDLFADSLAGSPLAAKKGMAVLLVDRVYVDQRIREYVNQLNPEGITVFGGEKAISKEALSLIKNEPVDIVGEGNIVNGGLATMSDGFIYYVNSSDGYRIYRENVSDGKVEKICDDSAGYINVQGQWVYYVNFSDDSKIYKIKTDGSSRHKLSDDRSGYLKLEGDFLYYTNDDDGYRIYRIKTDGSHRARLSNDVSFSIDVYDGFIYYINFSDNNRIYRIKTDGTGRKRISSDSSWCIVVSDDWIYFSNSSKDNSLYKIRTDGSGNSRIGKEQVLDLNVIGGWIYYGNLKDGNKLYKIKTDGSMKAKINDEGSYAISIAGDWVYYSNYEEDLSFYKVRMSGEDRIKIE